jgi:nicotinamide mononucleotide transporter
MSNVVTANGFAGLEPFQIKNVLISFVVATVLTGLSYAVGSGMGWITELNMLEVFSVWTSYSCTFLCVMQSRLNYPIGAISVASLMVLFFNQGLFASAILNLYLIPTLVYGWFRWRPDVVTKPVSRLGWNRWLFAYAAFTALAYGFCLAVNNFFNATLSYPDTAILVLSILAQFLLDNKKIETWMVWAVVNVLAIVTYWNAGLPLVSFQFMFFLANTLYGWWSWNKSMKQGIPV